LWAGRVEGIGSKNATLIDGNAAPLAIELDVEAPYQAALARVRACVETQTHGRPPAVVAHRVVHGGSKYTAPVRVDARVLADLKSYIPLAPLHQPFALEAIDVILTELPELPQVACFDTAFPQHASAGGADAAVAVCAVGTRRAALRLSRTSYEYMTIALAERHGDVAGGRTIVAHLGSGASLCAMDRPAKRRDDNGILGARRFDDGHAMRLDRSGVLLHLIEHEGFDVRRLTNLLYRESGLLGVSGVSASPKDLLEVEHINPRAHAALELYVGRIVREIGALVAVLGGLDMLVFHRRRRRAQRGVANAHLRGV
jgi:acetate kinase